MAYTLEFKQGGFILEHFGVTSIREIHQINAEVHGHPEFDKHRFQFIKLLNADFSKIDPTTADQPAATDWAAAKSRHAVKVAMLATQAEAVTFCQAYKDESEAMETNWQFRIFDNEEEAMEWLGLA